MSPDPREVLTRPAPPPDTTLHYGALPEHVADVYLPEAGDDTGTLVLVVHGGFWRAQYDRAHVRPMCHALAGAGYTVASVEFRRTGQAGGGWPGTFDDVAQAMDTVPTLLADAVGGPFPRVVLLGHSAGGHLATWAVSRPSLPPTCPWFRPDAGADMVVDLAGVNRAMGHAATDRMLMSIAQSLRPYAERVDGCFLGRLNGSDFALCLPVAGVARETAQALASLLKNAFEAIGRRCGLPAPCAWTPWLVCFVTVNGRDSFCSSGPAASLLHMSSAKLRLQTAQ